MSHTSSADLLVLHAVRTLGYGDTPAVAARVVMNEAHASEHLLDAQAHGWVTWSAFGSDGGWSLTDAGKSHNERSLAAELHATGAKSAVEAVYRDFLPLNDLVTKACTDVQLAEMALIDNRASRDTVRTTLTHAGAALVTIQARLTQHLDRFTGYHTRFSAAVQKASADSRWITGTDRDSAHRVWFELHEDLIATLGLTR
jgi:hypothetical protein